MKKRIKGLDVARALAIFGMIIVNFKVVFGQEGLPWLKTLAGLFEGKAAATFVVLAGIGLALMSNSAIANNDMAKLKRTQITIAKRSLFLFVVGLSYLFIWPADILHFYGIYMLITLLLFRSSGKVLLGLSLLFIMIYPILMVFFDYETAWNFATLEYSDFWSVRGFVRNLFYNGFHPVIPWTSFMLFGLWFGKKDLHDEKFLKRSFWISTASFIGIQIVSFVSIWFLSEGNQKSYQELSEIIGTSPMPPLPIYMFNGIAISISVITACILIAKRFEDSKIIDLLHKTGQLALTFYVAHVVIGMVIVDMIDTAKMGQYSIEFSFAYSIVFSFLCIVFAGFWRKYYKAGPLEWALRKITG